MAEVARRKGRLLQSLEHLKSAIEVIEDVRSRIPTPELRAGFVRESSRVYEDAIEILWRLHAREPTKSYDREALTYAEKGRSRAFLDLLAESRTQIMRGLTSDQARQQSTLNMELSRAALLEKDGDKS